MIKAIQPSYMDEHFQMKVHHIFFFPQLLIWILTTSTSLSKLWQFLQSYDKCLSFLTICITDVHVYILNQKQHPLENTLLQLKY